MIRFASTNGSRRPEATPPRTNAWVASTLEEVASLLEQQGASPFRVRAYQNGAESVRAWQEDVAYVLEARGRAGLEERAGIGPGLSGAIAELVVTGRLRMLDRLRGSVSPEDVFVTVPGIGPELARRIHDHLGIETLEELETAAWNGTLEHVPGFGARRTQAVRDVLAHRMRTMGLSEMWRRPDPGDAPSVEILLDVDRQYREDAEIGRLRRIAPRRFNPKHEAWLPILHTERGPWSLQALYSNTGQAHRLGRTGDWVVLYYARDGREGQATVVTERRGPLAGLRVVRGRERECELLYAARGIRPLAREEADVP